MKKIVVILVLVLSPFAMGLFAQCPEEDFKGVVITFDYHVGPFDPICVDADPPNPPPPDPNEVRRIYFVHGLGGTAESWEKVAEACWNTDLELHLKGFPARRCETTRPDYNNSTGSLASAADGLRSAIAYQAGIDRIYGIIDPARSILIAHSQGGLVTRQLMHYDMVQPGTGGTEHSSLSQGMNYGGVVTVASPLQGAKILDNRNDIFAWANDGCKKLLLGPILGAVVDASLNIEVKYLGSRVDISVDKIKTTLVDVMKDIVPSVCDVATDNVMPMFFKHYYDGITEDYMVGANKINTLNQDASNPTYKGFPKVALYGIEPQENIFWRTLNWMFYNPNGNNGANGPKVDYFEANDDWELYGNTIKPMIDYYTAKSIHYASLAKVYALTNQFTYFTLALNTDIAYLLGLEWFYRANEGWQTIIGARTYNPATQQCTMKPENDGVVLAESAKELPEAQKVVRVYPNESSTVDFEKGSSHMQIRNDAGLKEHLKKLLDGKYGRFFQTQEEH